MLSIAGPGSTVIFLQMCRGTLIETTPQKRGDGQSKGCFFVSFTSTVEGQHAARSLHNCLLPGTQRPERPYRWTQTRPAEA